MLENDFLFWGRKYLFINFFPLIPAVNAPARILVPEGQLANKSKLRLKHGGSKDVPPQKWRTQMSIGTPKVVYEIHQKRGRPIGS